MLERPELFKAREFFYSSFIFILLFLVSLSIDFYSYKQLQKQKNITLTCKVINQYIKTKNDHEYYILKLRCDDLTIYTSKGLYVGDLAQKKLHLYLDLSRLDFLGYLKGFYAKSKLLDVQEDESIKSKLNDFIANQHQDRDVTSIYKALYTAESQPLELRQKLSSLGVSHLMAISGFHLGVLSAVLYFLFGAFYKPLQSRYFPYRSRSRDLFVLVALVLFIYVWFLDFTPSLLRSFGMLLVGYFLYDRGLKVISMQTLLLTILLLVAIMPTLLLSLAFWLSAAGVFYIFLFLLYFAQTKKIYQFLLLPIFVYMAMLPYSVYIFGIFSLWHPLSILWSTLFTLFYPLSILLHVSGFGSLFDSWLIWLLAHVNTSVSLHVSSFFFYAQLLLSLFAIFKRSIFLLLALYDLFFLIEMVYQVA